MIRSVTPGDLWVLRRKPRNQVVLYNDSLLAYTHQPFWFANRCLLEGNNHDRTTLSFHERGLRAFVQVRGRQGSPEQDIIYLAAQGLVTGTHTSDHDIWYRLLEQTIVEAGQHHVQRLYTSVWNPQDDVREIFRQLNFQPYCRRVVLQLSGPDWDQGTRLALMRSQTRRDVWGIHKLYGKITPHIVQHAEVRTPRTWSLPLTRRWHWITPRAWVLGPSDNPSAYLHALSGPTAHVLTLLLDPAIREQAADIMRFGLSQLPDRKPIYLLLPTYQGELLTPAQNLGFHPIGEQTLLIRSNVRPVRSSVLLPTFEPIPEPHISVPQITVPREVSHSYGRTTRDDK